MEFIIPLLLLVVSALLVWGLVAFLGRSSKAQSSTASPRGKSPALFDRMSEAGAAAAAQRLDEDTHNKVYRYLAVGQMAQAAEIYHRATGVGRIEAFVDVQALYQFPQEHGAQEPPLEEVAGTDPFIPETDDQDTQLTDLTIPDEWLEQVAETPKPQRFEIQIHRQDETVTMSSEDLPPWIRDQIEAMVRDERLDDAAEALTEHTALEAAEAEDLIKIIARQIHATDDEGKD
ncbi:hypothetical protein [Enteractinococcus fodinae]|uniref:Uncharacterized protein n=1 Tax=Enteractinococcus fodinae TaxID=684663 RepID=A0ABU2B2C2_9MICC|nr:hypothetical protein [Enteractinococcus fodinae]MDR7347744.1 hypothetical protein [Enteractinococcus fodinae]